MNCDILIMSNINSTIAKWIFRDFVCEKSNEAIIKF